MEQDPTKPVVKVYRDNIVNFGNLELFKEKAIKLLNEIHGRNRPLDVFDFRIEGDELTAFGYWADEEIPEEGKVGEPIPPEMLKAQDAALATTTLAEEVKDLENDPAGGETLGDLDKEEIGPLDEGDQTDENVLTENENNAPEKDNANVDGPTTDASQAEGAGLDPAAEASLS